MFDKLGYTGSLLRKTWGEQLTGNFGFGLVFFLLSLPALAGIIAGATVLFGGSVALGWVIPGFAIVYLLALSLVQSALQSVFQAAVYLYALDPALLSVPLPDGSRRFPVKLVSGAMS